MKIDFAKFADKLAPAIVQDAATNKVLMLGYMNEQAFEQTRTSGKVTFYSRSKQRLWTKGETSGNFLIVADILHDCDADAILIKANPAGAVCHTGADTCFAEANESDDFLRSLEKTIAARKTSQPENSYTASLFAQGTAKISQKVGEEAVEVVIAAQHANQIDFKNEAADLLFHLLVLIQARELNLSDILETLKKRQR